MYDGQNVFRQRLPGSHRIGLTAVGIGTRSKTHPRDEIFSGFEPHELRHLCPRRVRQIAIVQHTHAVVNEGRSAQEGKRYAAEYPARPLSLAEQFGRIR